MQTYHIETIVAEEGVLTIQGLPLHCGERVEVIVKSHPLIELNQKNLYPLRGKSVQYKDPFDSVAEEDWEII
jgi:hypothetical protein